MPCYRCGVRQTDPSRGQSPWKRGVRQYSQILICPGCQDTVDWMAELDRCSRCSSVHLIKRLGEVECRDCGAIMAPEHSADAEDTGGARVLDEEPAGPAGPAGPGLGDAGLQAARPAVGSAAGPDRSPDLSEEVARALDRVLGQSLVSQSIQRTPDPEGEAGPAPGMAPGAGAGPVSGAASGSGAGVTGAGAGRRRPARTAAGQHAAAHPGAERHRAVRPGPDHQGDDRLDEVRPGAFAG